MSEKITLNLFYMSLITAVVAVLLTALAFQQSFQRQVKEDLRSQAELIAVACNESIAEQEDEQSELARFALNDLRITLIAPDGSVLYESAQTERGEPANHLDRPEVQAALREGSGADTRRSDTFGTNDYYYAERLSDGNVLRVSVSVGNLYRSLVQVYPVLLIILLVIIVLSVIFALVITRRLVKPIERLPGELDDPQLTEDRTRVYPELVPFVQEIQTQRRQQETMRQEFTANVTHELKTPLTSISGYAEMISTGLAKPEDVPRFAEKIQVESRRMLSLVNDILELSRLDQSKGLKNPEPVQLLSVAEECADQLTMTAGKRHVTISVTGAPCRVMGDENKLWELIYNLMDNAIRYNREGGRVDVIVRDGTVVVRDTGIGIPAAHQSRIFERFYRVDKSHSRQTGGTGLGLSIVKHIAEQHCARISVKSEEHVGTEITVVFPKID